MTQLEPLVAALGGEAPHLTLAEDHWQHWAAAARGAGLDLAPALGASGASARLWQRWRWPLRIAALAVLVNVVGINVEWLRLKREAAAVTQSHEPDLQGRLSEGAGDLRPAAQMRKNISLAKAAGGQPGADEFTALCAGFGEALSLLPQKDIIATLDYKERALQVKVKPNTVDAAALAQLRSALEGRKLELSETSPGAWQIRPRPAEGRIMSKLNQSIQSLRGQAAVFWQARTEQERKLLTVGGAVVGLALFYSLLIDPALSGSDKLRKQLPELRQQEAEMQALAREASSLQGQNSIAPTPMTRDSLNAGLSARGLNPQSINVTGEYAKLQFNGAQFAGLVAWLDAMRTESRINCRTRPASPRRRRRAWSTPR
jgi:type II secretory pathway component PulM